MSESVRICRICLAESGSDAGMSIFGEVPANVIFDCFSVVASEQNGYLPWICTTCLATSEVCHLNQVVKGSLDTVQNVEELIEEDSIEEVESIIEEESMIGEENIMDVGSMIEEANIIEEDIENFTSPETFSDSGEDTDSELSSVEFNYKAIKVKGMACCDCNKIFPNKESLTKHSEDDHKPESTKLKAGLHQCNICYAIFSTDSRLENHVKRRYEQTLYECLECQAIFRIKSRLQNHMAKHESNIRKSVQDHLCCIRQCTATFPTKDQLVKHAKTIHGPLRNINKSTRDSNDHVCQVCLDCFPSKYALVKHGLAKRDCSLPEPLVCLICGKSFKTMALLEAHENKHKDIKPHLCNKCTQSFHSYAILQRHRRKFHLNKLRHQCPNCPKSFAHKSELKKHLVFHLDLKPYKCETCSESFRQKVQLKNHSYRHTGERPYRCRYCQMGFCRGTDRKRHEMSAHTKEKPHKCRMCGAGFIRHQQLVVHMVRSHDGTRDAPFRCEFCKEGFTKSVELERHEQLVHGIRDVGTIGANGAKMEYAVAYE